jgi:uncharacterized protein YidB (DUF937 family)
MDLTQIATQLLSQKLGGSTQAESLAGPLSELLSGSSNGINMTNLVAKFSTQGHMQELLSSWLGDGENASLSSQQLSESLGQDKISAFASQLGLDEGQTTSALADVLPHNN